jgi:hypothetical protein
MSERHLHRLGADCAKNRAYLPKQKEGVPRRPLGAGLRRDGP